MIGLALIQLGFTAHKAVLNGRHKTVDDDRADDRPAAMPLTRLLAVAAWILSFAILMWLFGFPVGAALVTFAYLRFATRERWITAIVYAASVWVGLALIFGRLLEIEFPRPFLAEIFAGTLGM